MKENSKFGSDPLKNYGFGIMTYFNFMQKLMLVYIPICILAIIAMYGNYKDGALSDVQINNTGGLFKMLNMFTLANIGQSNRHCVSINYHSNHQGSNFIQKL